MSVSSSDVLAELERFDDDFVPADTIRPNADSLPDGDYDFEVIDADLGRTGTEGQGEAILRVGLKILAGPRSSGAIEHAYFFRTPEAVARLGADLVVMGFDADRWTREHGRSFSKELPAAILKLPGLKLKARKVTREGKGNDGTPRTFHNLYINGLLADGKNSSLPASPPAPAFEAPPQSNSTPTSEIPF